MSLDQFCRLLGKAGHEYAHLCPLLPTHQAGWSRADRHRWSEVAGPLLCQQERSLSGILARPFWPAFFFETEVAVCEVRGVRVCSLDHHSLVPSPEEQERPGPGVEAERPVKAGGDPCGQTSSRSDSSEAKGQTAWLTALVWPHQGQLILLGAMSEFTASLVHNLQPTMKYQAAPVSPSPTSQWGWGHLLEPWRPPGGLQGKKMSHRPVLSHTLGPTHFPQLFPLLPFHLPYFSSFFLLFVVSS